MGNLDDAIERFKYNAQPSSADSHAPATVGDIKKLISEIATLAEEIKDAIE